MSFLDYAEGERPRTSPTIDRSITEKHVKQFDENIKLSAIKNFTNILNLILTPSPEEKQFMAQEVLIRALKRQLAGIANIENFFKEGLPALLKVYKGTNISNIFLRISSCAPLVREKREIIDEQIAAVKNLNPGNEKNHQFMALLEREKVANSRFKTAVAELYQIKV